MMSQNKNGGDSVGTFYIDHMEESVFRHDKRERIRKNIGETLKPSYYVLDVFHLLIKDPRAAFQISKQWMVTLDPH